MNLNAHYLWASFFWGTIAGGYILYGWKQRSMVPFLAGLAMTAASIFVSSAALMSVLSLTIMVTVWWLVRRGY